MRSTEQALGAVMSVAGEYLGLPSVQKGQQMAVMLGLIFLAVFM
jgi:hypothetical protein